ncbi:MAG: aminotransferase class V-fold PLP-dependent enzyme, partial [Cyclobacteriaceae bacterium]
IAFADADIVYASVQKCFGLPAGLAVLICSPRAVQRAQQINENQHYNSLLFIRENALKWQTHYTPNVLNIYLLMATMKKYPGIEKVDELIRLRYESWLTFISRYNQMQILTGNTNLQSRTVITLQADSEIVEKIKAKAKSKGIILGNGYGPWKRDTIRIANFPAITEGEINYLKKFFNKFLG